MTDEVLVDLSKPLSYAGPKGDMVEATFIQLKAPTYKQLENFLPVKQAFMSAVTSIDASKIDVAGVDTDKDKEVKFTGAEALTVMMQSSCDMTKIYLYCSALFKSGAALLDGEQKLTTPLMESMELKDFDKLVGDYIANFIAASLMDGM